MWGLFARPRPLSRRADPGHRQAGRASPCIPARAAARLESRFDELRFGLPHPPALAHRLDRDTSGCLVLGRHPKALRRLGALFAGGQVEKVYWAVVEGRPAEAEGRIETGLRKLSRGTGWRMVVDPAGQQAVTDYRVLRRRRRVAPGSSCGRAPAGPISCASIAPSSAAPWSATPSMERRRRGAADALRARRSPCRSTRPGRRSRSPPRCRRTCSARCGSAMTRPRPTGL